MFDILSAEKNTGQPNYHLRWDLKPKVTSPTVKIYAGITPEAINFSQVLGTTDENFMELSDPYPGRHSYFYLQHHRSDKESGKVVASRSILLENGLNLRDLGGYRSRDGRTICWGKIFRSGQLNSLTPNDHKMLEHINIGTVCDFRHNTEREKFPVDLPPADRQMLNLDITPGSIASFFTEVSQKHAITAVDMQQIMCEINRELVNHYSDRYSTMLQGLLNNDDGFLFCCAAGKDRTGFGAAVIMMALDIPQETIIEDYMLSNYYLQISKQIERIKKYMHEQSEKTDIESMRPMFEVHPEYIQSALDEIVTRYGNTARFLEDGLGFSPQMQKQLQEKFLE